MFVPVRALGVKTRMMVGYGGVDLHTRGVLFMKAKCIDFDGVAWLRGMEAWHVFTLIWFVSVSIGLSRTGGSRPLLSGRWPTIPPKAFR